MIGKDPVNRGPIALADLFSQQARRRVEAKFVAIGRNDDVATYALAQRVLSCDYAWLEQGIVRREA